MGRLKYYLGVGIAHGKSGVYLCQRKYAKDLLTENGLLRTKPVDIWMMIQVFEMTPKNSLKKKPSIDDLLVNLST